MPQLGKPVRGLVQSFFQVWVGNGAGRPHVEGFVHAPSPPGAFSSGHPGAPGPASAWARWRRRILDRRCASPPPICSMQPASAATIHFASIFSAAEIFSSSMAQETSGNLTENDPPNPQHLSLPGSSWRFDVTPSSSFRGQSRSPRPRRRWQES